MVSLSIIIPAYNEEKRLRPTLEKIAVYLKARRWSHAEVLVVNDGSRDGTADLVRQFARENRAFRLLENPGNQGKGYAVRHGMREARGEWVLFSDADLSAPIEDLDKLIEAAEKNAAKIAIGSRALDRSLVSRHQPVAREMSGRFFNLVMRVVTGLPFKDTQCGFKLYHRDAARSVFPRQRLTGFGFDVEDLFIARQLGLKTIEVPVRWADVEGTKVSMLSGLDAFIDLLRVRWNGLCGRYKP